MKRAEIGDLVLVIWDDATGDSSWGSNPREPRLSDCTTSGYLLHVSKRRIVLGASHARRASDKLGERLTIPRDSVRRVLRLRVGARRRLP